MKINALLALSLLASCCVYADERKESGMTAKEHHDSAIHYKREAERHKEEAATCRARAAHHRTAAHNLSILDERDQKMSRPHEASK